MTQAPQQAEPHVTAKNAGQASGLFFCVANLALALAADAQSPTVDLSGYSTRCEVSVRYQGQQLLARWPMAAGEWGQLTLDLRAARPLIESLGIASSATGAATPLLQGVEPVTSLTVGTRSAPAERPPEMSIWNTFFDKVPSRPYHTDRARLDLKHVRVASQGRRASVALGPVTTGRFSGELVFTFYAGSRLIHMETVVATDEDRRAILYEAGLVGGEGWKNIAWVDTDGKFQRESAESPPNARPVAVRHRTIIAQTAAGSMACFPPPHQFFSPRDFTDNLRTVWFGQGGSVGNDRFGFGIRQSPDGGGSWIPWINAPPGTRQRLGLFLLLTRGDADEALRETLRYTHGDRFPALPGHVTYTSHFHLAHAAGVMQARMEGKTPPVVPEFVQQFKRMGVNAVHLAEFHGDGHQKDAGPLRLPELETMFAECRRLSGENLLLIPGEDVSGILGANEPGKHPGHWMGLFPKPVHWTQVRQPDEPFAETHPKYGTVYHVGTAADMSDLLRREHGLGWTVHPRIKASSWTPDIFRNEDFFKTDLWLGGAWKAMPADLSRERLGERVLDLLDDMANWGVRKYTPGEVDTFKLFNDHEIYGHMNINCLQLDRLPHFDDGWQPVLDTLRAGKFFTTTGEVLIHEFTVGGKHSGESLKGASKPELRAQIEWTFPLKIAEVISGDGAKVYRERIELADTSAFGQRKLSLRPDLRGRKWVRFEVWDVAANGAFTQPVWISE